MKKYDFSKEFGNIDPKYIEEAEREWSEKKENCCKILSFF